MKRFVSSTVRNRSRLMRSGHAACSSDSAHDSQSRGIKFLRMSLRIGLACVFFLQSAPAYSQGLQKEWVREFALDPTKANGPIGALVAPDGTLVVAGTAQSATGDKDYQVIKYRSNGDEAWRASYASTPAGTIDDARGMAIDPNGNIIVTGTSSTVKFNSAGQQKWSVPVPGRAVIANAQYVYVTGISDQDIVTAQLENNETDGKENWRRVLDGVNHHTDIGYVITADASGNIYVGGQIGFGCVVPDQCDSRLGVISYTATGAQRFVGNTPYFGNTVSVQVLSIVASNDGSSAVFGNNANGPVFAKFSATGTFEWSHTYATLLANEAGKMIQDPITGNFVIAGKRHKSGTLVDEAFVGFIKADRTYQRIWTHSSEIGFTPATDLVQDSSGNLVVIGNTSDDGASSLMFTAKLMRSGRQIGLDRYITPGRASNFAVAAAVDAVNNAYVTGYTVNAQGGTEWVTIKYPAVPTIEKTATGAVHLEFYTAPGQQYALEATTDFFDWQSLITNTADANGVVQFDDAAATTIPYRFYRGRTTP